MRKTIIALATLAPLSLNLSAQYFTSGEMEGKIVSKEYIETLATANDYIGAKVLDIKGDKIGSIKDISIDTVDGEVTNAFISVGGFLNIGDNIIRVPFKQLKYRQSDNCFIVSSYKEDIVKSIDNMTESWDEKAEKKWETMTDTTEKFLDDTWAKIKDSTGLNQKDLADIEVYRKNNKVYLEGKVKNEILKQEIESNAKQYYGLGIVNRIRVEK